ncbi:hypothetical protein EDB89DRAFT_2008834 [Lactarius sanguifluus]|nr:hypothetical protein EDB89DRAFT_2008834 [Lactarius sanguifluus]
MLSGVFSVTGILRCRLTPVERVHRKGISLHGPGADIFIENMYRAEDRVLTKEISCMRFFLITSAIRSCAGNWCRGAASREVVCPNCAAYFGDALPCSSPRAGLATPANGSFFAAIHGAVKFHYIYRSSHSFDKPLSGPCDTDG